MSSGDGPNVPVQGLRERAADCEENVVIRLNMLVLLIRSNENIVGLGNGRAIDHR